MSVIEHDLGDTAVDLDPDQMTLALRRLARRGALDLVADLGLDGRAGRCTHKHSDKRVCHLDGGHNGDHEFGGVWR